MQGIEGAIEEILDDYRRLADHPQAVDPARGAAKEILGLMAQGWDEGRAVGKTECDCQPLNHTDPNPYDQEIKW